MNRDEIAARQAGMQGQGKAPAPDDALIKLIEEMRSAAQSDPARRREIAIGEFLVDGSRVPISLVTPLEALTRAEAAVLRFAGWGRSNADIGILLAISEGTARTHMTNAIRKLELDGMRSLIALGGLLFHSLD